MFVYKQCCHATEMYHSDSVCAQNSSGQMCTDSFHAVQTFFTEMFLIVNRNNIISCSLIFFNWVSHVGNTIAAVEFIQVLTLSILIFEIYSDNVPSLSAFFCRKQSNPIS